MSDTPRSVEDGHAGSQTGSDSQDEGIRTQAILDELERLTAPGEFDKLEELAESYRVDNIRRVLARINATVIDLDLFLKDPLTMRVLGQHGSQEERQRDYAEIQNRVNILKEVIEMAKKDIQELVDTYMPDVDSDEIADVVEKVTRELQLLDEFCKLF
ncbi:hypothetical protein N0V84_012624 [Fusarium piperis]|uniref:Uncharacterized protein n=1 Tax=Fusarium piperis TaxID=1435070 RepID=A0A9W8W256_9HYPO|nr:hypothetical protein N0V84_012624 [Fusarium piperis]